MELLLPRLRPDQMEIIRHPARWKWIAAGRRWGKTTMAGSLCIAVADHGGAVAWVAPTYRSSRPLWRFAQRAIAPALPALHVSIAERIIGFPSGGWLGVYTAEHDVSLRGESFDLVVIDEAARIAEETWTDVILPTLADRDGRAMLISTPAGMNWWSREWRRARDDRSGLSAAWRAASAANPMPTIQRAAQLARERLSERTYRQEWLAEFVDDAGGVFRFVRERSCAPPRDPDPDAEYLIGVDWGRSHDETVCSVWDIARRMEVHLDRYTDAPWAVQYDRVAALAARYGDALVIAEANAAQDAHVEALARLGVRVTPHITTAVSKALAVERMAAALERGDLMLLDDPTGIEQMQAFAGERLPSGMMRYSAPAGLHDDIVMARIIAWSALADAPPLFPWDGDDGLYRQE